MSELAIPPVNTASQTASPPAGPLEPDNDYGESVDIGSIGNGSGSSWFEFD